MSLLQPREFEIQKSTGVDDGIGGKTWSWAEHLHITGYLDMQSGTDANTVQPAFLREATHVLVTDRYFPGVTEKMRLVDSYGRIYSILFVDDPVDLHHHIEIYAKEVGADGY